MPAIDFNGLDTAVHGPLRLGVLTALQTQGARDFTSLKEMLQATDGALGMHLQKLGSAWKFPFDCRLARPRDGGTQDRERGSHKLPGTCAFAILLSF